MSYNKSIFLLLASLLGFYISYEVPGIVITFFVSFIFAYLLEPIVTYIDKKTHYLGYKSSAIIVFVIFLIFLLTFFIFFIPKITSQLHLLFLKIPDYHAKIKSSFLPFISKKIELYGGKNLTAQFSKSIAAITNDASQHLINSMNSLWDYTLSFINLLSLVILFPVLLIFFLSDWHKVTTKIQKTISEVGLSPLNNVWEDIDKLLKGYVQSIFTLASVMCIIYMICFTIIDLDLSIILGLISGMAIIIPFLGTLSAYIMCVSLSLLSNGLHVEQVWISIIFACAQSFEGMYLSPKIIGNKIGMHPLVIIFSVFVASNILGFAGLFVAIPIAGILRILFRRFVLPDKIIH